MIKNKTPLITIVLVALSFWACEKEKDEGSTQSNTVVDCSDYANWAYFTFDTGESYTESSESEDFLNSLDWDIAFHRYNFRLNGGESGSGQAGTILLGIGAIDDYSEAPLTGYVQDDSISIMTSGAMPPVYISVPGSQYLCGYYDDPEDETTYHEGAWNIESGRPPIYHPTDKIYAIRTAKGNYAIIKFEDYYDEWGVAGYVTFSYKYNANGSNKF